MNPKLTQAVLDIHASPDPTRVVIAMAGNGMQAIAELMRYGNGSRTLISQHLLYDNSTFNTYIKGVPDKYVDPRASRQLAMAAYMEARSIVDDPGIDVKSLLNNRPVIGIGTTSSLVRTDLKGDNDERAGREHWIHLSLQTKVETRTVSIKLDSSLNRTRTEEEWIASLAILTMVAAARGAGPGMNELFQESLAPTDVVTKEQYCVSQNEILISDVMHSRADCYSHKCAFPDYKMVVFAGSWNPLHTAHKALMALAESILNVEGVYELSITNTDKPPLDFIEIKKRLDQFDEIDNPVVLTNSSRYINKSMIFPAGTAFVMGADTFARVVAPFYAMDVGIDATITHFERQKTKFLVAARKHPITDEIQTVASILERMTGVGMKTFAERWRALSIAIPQTEFLLDMSSSSIRKGG